MLCGQNAGKKKIDTKKSSTYIQFKSSKNETILFKDAY